MKNIKIRIVFTIGILCGLGIAFAYTGLANEEAKKVKYVVSTEETVSFTHPKSKAVATPYVDEKILGQKVDDIYLGTLVVPAGVEIPGHAHQNETEIIYVLEGTGEMTITGFGTSIVSKGSLVYMPKGTEHSFKVIGDTDVKAVQVWTPGGPQQKYYNW